MSNIRKPNMNKPKPATPLQIEQARALYAEVSDNFIEVDDDAGVSESEDGVWVQAWVLISHSPV